MDLISSASYLLFWIFFLQIASVLMDQRKFCNFDGDNSCSLWNYTSSFRVIFEDFWNEEDSSSRFFPPHPGGKLVQTNCQNPSTDLPVVHTAWIDTNSSSSSCVFSFDLIILDRKRLEAMEVILQRRGLHDHILWSSADVNEDTIRSGWHNYRIVIGRVMEPFRIVLESLCMAQSEKTMNTSLLALDNLQIEDCFTGLMEDSPCSPEKLACHPSGTCLDADVLCDFTTDCPDGSDESGGICDVLPEGARCDFENGLCKWTPLQDFPTGNSTSAGWSRTSSITTATSRLPSGVPFGLSRGFILNFDQSKSQTQKLVSQIRSPTFPRLTGHSSCKVRFTYRNSGLTDGSVVLMVNQAVPNGQRSTIWQLRHDKNADYSVTWKRISVPIVNVHSRYFLRFIGVHSPRGGSFAIDDLSLSRACFFQGLNDSTIEEDNQGDDLQFEKQFRVTDCGKSGPSGPGSKDCLHQQARNLVVLEDGTTEHGSLQGIQQWTVPVSGVYNITAVGATGGGLSSTDQANACSGAAASGLFRLDAGQLVNFIVGQRGQHACSRDTDGCRAYGAGGGGATFVFRDFYESGKVVSSIPLVIAAGGAGRSRQKRPCPLHSLETKAGPLEGDADLRMLAANLLAGKDKSSSVVGAILEGECQDETKKRQGGFGGGSASCGVIGGAGGDLMSVRHGSFNSNNDSSQSPVSFVNLQISTATKIWNLDGVHSGEVTVMILCNCSVACVVDRQTRDYLCPNLYPQGPETDLPEKLPLNYLLAALLLAASVVGISICCKGCLLKFPVYLGTRKESAKCIGRRCRREFFCCETEVAQAEDEDIRLHRVGPGNFSSMEINQLYELNGVQKFEDLRRIPKNLIQLKQPLGQGAFGVVYQGTLKTDNSKYLPVAVKTLPEMSSAESAVEFAAEALIVCKFHHPNVVHCFGVSFNAPSKYIVLELLPGGDVRSFLRRCRTTFDGIVVTMVELMEIATDIAKGCQYLEQHHFVHRDIAARNCLLTSTERHRVAKIADFGMARDVVRSEYYRRNSSTLLPVRWMPPEALQEGVYSTKSDIWAYGIFLWEVLSVGCSPYAGLTNQEVIQYVVGGGRLSQPSRHCPLELYELMSQCWTRAPLERRQYSEIIATLLGLMGVTSVATAAVPDEKDAPLPLARIPEAKNPTSHEFPQTEPLTDTVTNSGNLDRSDDRIQEQATQKPLFPFPKHSR